MRLLKTLRFLTGGWLAGLVLGGAALAQPTPAAPAYEMGVVLIQYDEAVYTAHLEDLLDDLLDKLPGGLGGFVGDQADVDIPLRPVGVVDDLLRTNGFPLAEVIARLDSLQTEAIDVGVEVDPHTVIARLKANPRAGVLHAQPNFLYYPHQTSAAYTTDQTSDPDPARTAAWHLKAIQLRDAWDEVWDRAQARPTGAGPITIGILDTGVNFSDRDLAGKKWSKTACLDENGMATTCNGGRDFVGTTHDADPSSSHKHGTWVAGVAAGEFNNGYGSFGVAQDVEIVGIRVYDKTVPFTTLDVVQGVDFARYNQIDIINVSLGRDHSYQSCTAYSMTPANSLTVEYQALHNYSAGLFVIAAGNDLKESGGVDTVSLPPDFASDLSLNGQQCWPGLDNVIAVGGTELDQANNRERIWNSTTYGAHIDIAAGAKDIPTLNTWLDGTSYAAPQVAGVAALMLMVNPTLTPGELKAKLRASADIFEDFDGLDAVGNVRVTERNLAGGRRLNAYRAVKLALEEATVQIDPLPEIVANTDPFTSSAPLVLREQGLSEAGGWEITEYDPVEVGWIGSEDDNAVSSLLISAGYTVEVFRDRDFMGTSQTYVGPQNVDLTGHPLNNQISSYKLSVMSPLVLREHELGVSGGWEITQTAPVEVAGMGADGDQVSSLLIDAGYTVEVYRHPDFKGARLTYVGPQAVDLTGQSLDNQISSYKLYVTVAVAVDPVLVLREHELGAAGGWEIVEYGPTEVARMGWGRRNDQVSSLLIDAGYTVKVFLHRDFTGTRETYVGPQNVDLTGTSLDNQISSYKLYVTPDSAVAETLVLRERGLHEAGGWEIAQTAPVAVAGMGARNDQVSSLHIADGYTVQVFRYDNFKAARQTYVGPQSVDLTGNVLDNRINSYKFYATPAVPVAEALVLRESRVGEPSAWEIAHNDPVEVGWIGWADNDQVSSLSVAAGYTVEVFRRDAFRGARERYVGPQSVDLAALNNDVSSYRLSLTSAGTPPEVLVLRDKGVGEPGGVEIVHSAPAEVTRLVPGDNNIISSLTLAAGYTVEVFRYYSFKGTRQTYIGPQSVDLAGDTLNNDISSYKVYDTPALMLREHGPAEAGGWEITQTAPVEVGWIGGAHNDAVSSLLIGDGYTVQVFRHENYTGAQWTYVGPQEVDLAGSGLDNQISSYKLYATPVAALVLRDQGVNGAGGWEIVHTGPVEVAWIGAAHNDRVSSLRIGAGYTVEVFRDWAFNGPAQTYVGPQAVGLGAHGMNNQLSSYKLYATAPLTLREHGLGTAGGWEIAQPAPVEVSWIGGAHNDQVSSLVVGAGYTVEVFRHARFQGTSQTYVGPQSVDLSGNTLDNQISSYKVYDTP